MRNKENNWRRDGAGRTGSLTQPSYFFASTKVKESSVQVAFNHRNIELQASRLITTCPVDPFMLQDKEYHISKHGFLKI